MRSLLLQIRQSALSMASELPGLYVLDDPFKPYIHPLKTPAGHTVSLAMPHDHPHHKGSMYALRTPR